MPYRLWSRPFARVSLPPTRGVHVILAALNTQTHLLLGLAVLDPLSSRYPARS